MPKIPMQKGLVPVDGYVFLPQLYVRVAAHVLHTCGKQSRMLSQTAGSLRYML